MRVNMTPEEAMEIEVRQLKEMAARFGGAMDREREKRRAAYRRAREEGLVWERRPKRKIF